MLHTLSTAISGKQAILVEAFVVAHVRLAEVSVQDELLIINLSGIETHGLGNIGNSRQLSAHGSVLFASQRYLSSSYAGWRLLLDPTVIEKIFDLVESLELGLAYYNDYTSSPAPEGSRFTQIQSPGPVARSLKDYLRAQELVELSEFKNLLSSNESKP